MERNDSFLKKVVAHRGQILAMIVATVRDFNDAEDVFQDTMAELIEHGERYDAGRDFLPWARGVARNMVRRHYRARAAAPLGDIDDLEFLTDVVCEEADSDAWETERRFLRPCLRQIGPESRRLFLLRYASNLRGKALASRAGRRETSLRTSLFRIRETLRRCIEQQMRGERNEGLPGYEQGI